MGFREGLRRAGFLFVFRRLDFGFIVPFPLSACTCDAEGNAASVRVLGVIVLTGSAFTGEFRSAVLAGMRLSSGPMLVRAEGPRSHLKSPEH